MSCHKDKVFLADLILDPDHATAEARRHVAECPECAEELSGLEATMKALEQWGAPDPSGFFDAKLHARLRRERELAPAGFFARWHSWMLYSSRFRMRQWAAGALAAMIIVGAGSYVAVSYLDTPATPQLSATVRDLKSFDSEQALFQQLNALDAPVENSSGASN